MPEEPLKSRLKSSPPPAFPVALSKAVAPGHPCSAPLPHPAAPVQHQPQPRSAVRRLAPGRSGGAPARRGVAGGENAGGLQGVRSRGRKKGFGIPIRRRAYE